jgi:hypothetical protein
VSSIPKYEHKESSHHSTTRNGKLVHIKIDRKDKKMTLKKVLSEIERLQAENPDLEVFFDGDEYAICSRPKDPLKSL